jgi:hypothetical membrane protein
VNDVTRTLLLLGAIAGPLYVFVAAAQVLTRDGFDITRHPVSMLSNGDFGWVQVLNFILVGALVTGASIGLRRVLSDGAGQKWAPILLAFFGIGLIGSGVFIADPGDGFPPGTPAGDAVEFTTSGILHFAFGGVAFVSLSATCLVFARRFSQLNEPRMSMFSAFIGVFYLVAFVSVAASAGAVWANLMLTAAVILGWVWLTMLMSGIAEQLPASEDQPVTPVARNT